MFLQEARQSLLYIIGLLLSANVNEQTKLDIDHDEKKKMFT